MREIGSLMKVPIREVWPDEAADLTPYLAETPGLLSKALGMDLELVGTEVPVGRFNADILFRAKDRNALVVVENMMGSTDHDHLGKAITYASGLDVGDNEERLAATYAILLAEGFRPEHRTALTWLNKHTKEAVGFFGIRIEAWRISDSPPALQLSVIVHPDGWVKQVRAQSGAREATESGQRYREFWASFIPEFHAAHSGWSRSKTPPYANWMRFPTGRSGTFYSVSWFGKNKEEQGFRVEFAVDLSETEEADRIYCGLEGQRSEIEERFGERLVWDEVEGRRVRRIYARHPSGDFDIKDRERWPEVREWAIKRLGDLRDAIQPHLDELAADDG